MGGTGLRPVVAGLRPGTVATRITGTRAFVDQAGSSPENAAGREFGPAGGPVPPWVEFAHWFHMRPGFGCVFFHPSSAYNHQLAEE